MGFLFSVHLHSCAVQNYSCEIRTQMGMVTFCFLLRLGLFGPLICQWRDSLKADAAFVVSGEFMQYCHFDNGIYWPVAV